MGAEVEAVVLPKVADPEALGVLGDLVGLESSRLRQSLRIL